MSKTVESHILKEYSLLRQMGSGAYGHVWEVKEKKTGRNLALKKVFDAFRNSIDAQRTYREVQVLHQLHHSNIIKLYRVIKSKNNKDLYLVFEFMETDLHSVVGTNILEKMHQVFIFYQILKGICFIHSAQLIHRDLKPSNILINSECSTKICDFGLIRSLATINQTQHQEVVLSQEVATKWYRAPQLLLGSRNYGKPVDMWSFGCIIAQILIGKPLFAGSSTLSQFQKILQYTGNPSKADLQSLQSPIAEQLLDQMKIKGKSFGDYFHNVDPVFYELLKGSLQLNPNKRLSVEEALQLKIFEDFFDQPIILANKPILPKINDNIRLTTKAYRQKIYQDIQLRYQPIVFKNKINEIRNYNSMDNRKISGTESSKNHPFNNQYKKRTSSKKRVVSAKKYSSTTVHNNSYGYSLEKNKSSSYVGYHKSLQTGSNAIKNSPYYKSLNTHTSSCNINPNSFSVHKQRNKSGSQIKDDRKFPKYHENMVNRKDAISKVSEKIRKNIKKGSKYRLDEGEKKNILKSIGVEKGKKLIKYIK